MAVMSVVPFMLVPLVPLTEVEPFVFIEPDIEPFIDPEGMFIEPALVVPVRFDDPVVPLVVPYVVAVVLCVDDVGAVDVCESVELVVAVLLVLDVVAWPDVSLDDDVIDPLLLTSVPVVGAVELQPNMAAVSTSEAPSAMKLLRIPFMISPLS